MTRSTAARPSDVWGVLADGWLYATWVVGASRVREVDAAWPATGSRIHHSFGAWPAVIDDETVVLDAVPEQSLVLRPRGWPAGEAVVDLRIVEADDGCELTIVEDAVAGPGALVPKALRQRLIAVRNTEALRRLTLVAEGRRRERSVAGE
ncbi:MAG: SRPBCC family protein [Lapillicoccus sp.]